MGGSEGTGGALGFKWSVQRDVRRGSDGEMKRRHKRRVRDNRLGRPGGILRA